MMAPFVRFIFYFWSGLPPGTIKSEDLNCLHRVPTQPVLPLPQLGRTLPFYTEGNNGF
jgi:hypothetical protein